MHVMSGMSSRMEERIGATCLEGREFKEKIISIMCLTLTKIWSPTKFVPEINSIYLYNWGFPSDSLVKNLPAKVGDRGSIPELGRSPRGGNGNLLQYSCLGNPLDRGAWCATVHGVAESRTRLSNQTRML